MVSEKHRDKSTTGDIDTDVSFSSLRQDIVKQLGLGDADDWDLALIPASYATTLDNYVPADHDTLLLVPKSESRQRPFRPTQPTN